MVKIMNFSIEEANNIMATEGKILNKFGYLGGGYYKDQSRNHRIYLAVRKKMRKLPKLDPKYYDYFEKENFHSLNSLLVDLKKL